MTDEELISQLESLRENSQSFLDKNEPDSIWQKDIEAIDEAIRRIKLLAEIQKNIHIGSTVADITQRR